MTLGIMKKILYLNDKPLLKRIKDNADKISALSKRINSTEQLLQERNSLLEQQNNELIEQNELLKQELVQLAFMAGISKSV